MEKFLSIVRWILHKLSLALLGTAIWFFIPLLGVSINVTDSAQVKDWLSSTDTYSTISTHLPSLIEVESEGGNSPNDKPSKIDQKALITAIAPALDKEFLQTNTEEVINGFYSWLDGDTFEPEFSVSLAPKKDEISKLMLAELTNQVQKLPECSPTEISENTSFDLERSNCIPEGVDIKQQAQKSVTEAIGDKEGPFAQEFNADKLNLSTEVKTGAPIVFESLKLMPMFFWAFFVALILIVVLTSRTKPRGLKEAGFTVGIAAGIITAISAIGSRLSGTPGNLIVNQEDSGEKGQAAKAIFEPLIKAAVTDFASTALTFSFIVLVIGVALYVLGWKLDKTNSDKQPEHKEDEVPELMREDGNNDFIHKAHEEKNQKPKITEKIKKRLIQ